MPLSDIIIPAGKIIVILSGSALGLAPAGKALNFGTVQRVNDLCDSTTVGSSVWFDITNATPFMIISGQIFYMVDEDTIISGETYVP